MVIAPFFFQKYLYPGFCRKNFPAVLIYHVKGLVLRNTHVQYESSISSGKKVMAKVKVFAHAHTLTRMPTMTQTFSTLEPWTFVPARYLKIFSVSLNSN